MVKLFDPDGDLLASGDLATSPETATYSPGGTIPPGIYPAQVCPFEDPTVPFAPPGNYAARRDHLGQRRRRRPPPNLPRWRYFTANPTLDYSPGTTPTNTVIGCWVRGPGCTAPPGRSRSPTAPAVGHDHATTDADVHHRRQQRQQPRGLGQPAHARRHRAGAGLADPGVHRPVHRRLEQLQVRPDPAAPRRQRHQLAAHQPVRRPQPDARLLLLPRLHRANYNLQQDNLGRGGATGERPGDRQRPGRRSHRRQPVVPRS